MSRSLKNCLLPNRHFLLGIFILVLNINLSSQIANYVSNGGFEKIDLVHPFGNVNCATYWQPIDTIKFCYYLWTTTSSPSLAAPAPYIPTGFQYPRTGSTLILSQFYCSPITCTSTTDNARGYPRNRLKQPLKPNVTYCAKYYVVNTNNSPVITDSYGAYFGDSSLDSISYCNQPLVYLTPQVEWLGNIITDTLNWTAISGTFIATGTEKYMVLGNFRSNSATNTLILNSGNLLTHDLYIDDVSLIEMDLPAYAGPDKNLIAGDSVYIGRESDVEIDESCIWFQMTSPTASVTIDTIAGMWVKPIATTTYVVRQQLWCSGVKWDTVVVHMDYVGDKEFLLLNDELKVFPNPADEFLQVQYSFDVTNNFNEVLVYNQFGQMIFQDSISFKNRKATIPISNLDVGVYSIELRSISGQTVKKRFVVSR